MRELQSILYNRYIFEFYCCGMLAPVLEDVIFLRTVLSILTCLGLIKAKFLLLGFRRL